MKSMKKSVIRNAMSLYAVVLLVLMVYISMLAGCKKSTSTENPPDTATVGLRFVFMADSRGDSLGYTIDTTALNPIIRCIDTLKPKPSFIVLGGDMCYRGYVDKQYTFQTFKNLFAKPMARGIALYTAVGNHELYHQHSRYGFLKVNQEQFQTVFSENPSNGPAGYEHLAYSFTDANSSSFFAVLDPYYLTTDTLHPKGLGGHIDEVQMNWLKSQVAQSGAKHKFLFIHCPYYYISNETLEPSQSDTSYTHLWSFLDNSKFDIYACGHSHLYARRTIESSLQPLPQTNPFTAPWQNNVVQLLNGTCGAGPDSGEIDPNVRKEWNVHDGAKTYYFSVIDVAGSTTTVNRYEFFFAAGC